MLALKYECFRDACAELLQRNVGARWWWWSRASVGWVRPPILAICQAHWRFFELDWFLECMQPQPQYFPGVCRSSFTAVPNLSAPARDCQRLCSKCCQRSGLLLKWILAASSVRFYWWKPFYHWKVYDPRGCLSQSWRSCSEAERLNRSIPPHRHGTVTAVRRGPQSRLVFPPNYFWIGWHSHFVIAFVSLLNTLLVYWHPLVLICTTDVPTKQHCETI